MKKIFSFVAAMVFALAINAAETNVAPGTGGPLRDAVSAAAAGDVLILTDGVYEEPEVVSLNKNLTIKAAEGTHPVVAQQYYMKLLSSAQVTFIGIKFDGGLYNNGQGANDHFIRPYDNTANKTLTLIDCEVCNWKSYVLYPQRADRCMQSLTIQNCYFHDNVRSAVYVETGSSSPCPLAVLNVENSTFVGTSASYRAIDVKNGGDAVADAQIRIDHCTFYNYSSVRSQNSTDVIISNSIFAFPTAGSTLATELPAGAAINNCLTFNTTHAEGPTVTNPVTGDPLFADAANGDLTLGAGSPALGAATDGGNLGAPRWFPAVAPAKPTVAIAGSMNSWSAEANVMTEAEDGLSASCTINLTDWYYEFKVVVDGAWLSLNGDGDLYTLHRDWNKVSGLQAENSNFKLTPDVVPGDYTFKWTYATGELEIIFPEKPMPVVALAGDMNSWNAEANVLTMAEDSLTASVTVALEAGNYDFKMVVDGHWLAKDATYEVKRDWTMVDNVNQEISMGPNMKLIADMAGDYTFTWEYATNNLTVTFPALPVVYNWSAVEAEQVGTTILGNTDETITTVKIHENKDDVNCIKFGKSYSYADGKYIAIKPAEGGFKAGDILSVAVVFNNSDATKYCMIDLRAADGDTRIWLSDSASTINGRTAAGEPIVQTYTLEADQDSLFIGRYGNTGMCITLLNVVRTASETPELDYYLVGSMNSWTASDADKFAANPDQEGEYVLLTSLTEGATLKVVDSNNHWYPGGSNYTVPAELAGLVTVYFRPAGNADWVSFHEGGYIYIATREPGTGIDNTEVVEKAVKMIENGQLIIIKNGVRYNVMGIMVK